MPGPLALPAKFVPGISVLYQRRVVLLGGNIHLDVRQIFAFKVLGDRAGHISLVFLGFLGCLPSARNAGVEGARPYGFTAKAATFASDFNDINFDRSVGLVGGVAKTRQDKKNNQSQD